MGQSIEDGNGLFPGQARVGDAATVDERLGIQRLVSADKVAFEHGGCDGGFTVGDLLGQCSGDGGLFFGVLAAVRVAAVHHDERRKRLVSEQRLGFGDVLG